jgi:hypothetical protein
LKWERRKNDFLIISNATKGTFQQMNKIHYFSSAFSIKSKELAWNQLCIFSLSAISIPSGSEESSKWFARGNIFHKRIKNSVPHCQSLCLARNIFRIDAARLFPHSLCTERARGGSHSKVIL